MVPLCLLCRRARGGVVMITLKPSQYSVPSHTAKPVKYLATFSTGLQIKRVSRRVYTHAWLVSYTENGEPSRITGFAGSAPLAQEAAQAWVKRMTKWGADPRNVDKIAGLSVEVVGAFK